MITEIRHPFYSAEYMNWLEWRLTYEGGPSFVNAYLERFSDRETDADFQRRVRLTPIPAFAKAAVDEIKNAIFQRLLDVTRTNGPDSYMSAVTGEGDGVDLHGSTMDFFMGETVLLELLVMGRVGIYTDSPPVGPTAADAATPYIYRYRPEDILSWTYHPRRRTEFSQLLLRDYETVTSDGFGLANDIIERYRHITLTDEGVKVEFYSREVDGDKKKEFITDEVMLDLDRIPFTMLCLPHSIISDVTRHQIALLNMESADISYALDSNFTLYTEQVERRDFTDYVAGPEGVEKEIVLSNKRARKYGKNLDRPDFIAPPTEPILASMKKQEQLKKDIRELVHLAVSNLGKVSADSKEMDQRGLEAGLSQIGLVLEHGERRIAQFWADYLNTPSPYISYPRRYNLRSDAERRADAESMLDMRSLVVSKAFQNELTYQAADTLIGHKTSKEIMDKIRREIDNADAYSSDLKTILESVSAGILDLVTAAKLLGYPEAVVAKAAEEHAERAARILASQTAARGVPDAAVDPQAAPAEKEGKEGRGAGRFAQDPQT